MPSKEVFIPRINKPRNGVNLCTIMGNKATKGDIGIEIEMEGKNLPLQNIPPWEYHIDNSLRAPPGGTCAEYVLSKPIAFDAVPDALNTLWAAFKANKTRFVDSNRTSVHIHLNCQQFFLNRLTSFLALYFIIEEGLTEWCGEYRVGNLFCLRAKDASAITSYIKAFIQADGNAPIQEFLHYSAMNANALKKYGSLEVRTLRGTSDPTVILDWVEVLERLYKLSEEYPDPRDVCASLSSVGALAFFENILGPKYKTIRSGINMTDGEISDSVMQGVRIAQDLCYCRDWGLYKPTKLKPDVFGRNMKNVAKRLLNNPPVPPDVDAALLQALSNSNDIFNLEASPTVSWSPDFPMETPEPDWEDSDESEGYDEED